MPSDILVVPDYHAIPCVDNRRAKAIGNVIVQAKPDVVVCLGDWWDLQSLCKWSKSFELERKRYLEDIHTGLDAMERMFNPIRRAKRKTPRFIFLRGNHENRVFDLASDLPIYEGIIGPKDFELKQYGWEEHDFKTAVEVEGFLFSHHFASGAMGRPIGGKNIGATLIREVKQSAVVGHSHVFDHKVNNTRAGKPIHGFSAGCFTHPTNIEAWNRDTQHLYHKGLLLLTNASDGDASWQWIRQQDIL